MIIPSFEAEDEQFGSFLANLSRLHSIQSKDEKSEPVFVAR
jgi:hypothetical protein